MKTGILPVVIGNWKMNPQSGSLAVKLATELKKKLYTITDVEVVIAPPHLFLEGVARAKNSSKHCFLGAQNVHTAKLGAYTGETSLSMLQSTGVTHVILGHSERRELGESDSYINEKVIATLKAGLVPILCVGEVKRDHAGHYLTTIETQVRKALQAVSRGKLERVIVAYEPVWAIGTGHTPTGEEIHEMKLFIEKVLSDLYGRNFAQKVRILYGGSVNGKNAKELFVTGAVDGFLVGEASLHPDEFRDIVKAVIPHV